jgi:hypothetical protein
MNFHNKWTHLPCSGSKEAESNLEVNMRYSSDIQAENTSFKDNNVTKLIIYQLNKINFLIAMDEMFAFTVT